MTECFIAAAAAAAGSARVVERVASSRSVSGLFPLSPAVSYLITVACSSSSQCFAPHLALSGTASFCLTPAVPLLNQRQVRSTWLYCRHHLMSLQLLHLEHAVSIAHSTGCIKALDSLPLCQSCFKERPEGNRFVGTKASRCCCPPQVCLVSPAPAVKRHDFNYSAHASLIFESW